MTMDESPIPIEFQFIGRQKLQDMLDISGATIWRMVKDGRLPAPYNFGAKNYARWKLTEVIGSISKMQKADVNDLR